MTLKEKMYFDCTLNTDEQAEKNEKIADEYAIEFAEWILENRAKNVLLRNNPTTKELLEIFKKEKGL